MSISGHISKTESTMIKNMLVSIGRRISAHILSICVFCICLLLVGGLVQLISSTAFSNYFDNKWSLSTSGPNEYSGGDGDDPIIKLNLAKNYRRIAKEHQSQELPSKQFENIENTHKSTNQILSTERKSESGDDNNRHDESNGLIVNSTKNTSEAASASIWPNAINNNKEVIDWINHYHENANNDDDTIYIDSDDDSSSPVYEADSQQASMEISDKNIFISNNNDADAIPQPSAQPKIKNSDENRSHTKLPQVGRHFRNKKSSKHSSKTRPSFNDYRYVDGISNFDDDGEDDTEGDINSGSGDYSSWTYYIDLYNDFDKFQEITNGQRNTIPATKMPMPSKLRFDANVADDKTIAEKFSRAQNRIRNANRLKNNGNNNKKRKSSDPESNWLDTSSDAADDVNSKGDNDAWRENRVRRVLGNIKKSEERSRQILLCKGEGELCSMLFKAPIKAVANANIHNGE